MSWGMGIALAFDAVADLVCEGTDRDFAANLAALLLRHMRGGTWGIA